MFTLFYILPVGNLNWKKKNMCKSFFLMKRCHSLPRISTILHPLSTRLSTGFPERAQWVLKRLLLLLCNAYYYVCMCVCACKFADRWRQYSNHVQDWQSRGGNYWKLLVISVCYLLYNAMINEICDSLKKKKKLFKIYDAVMVWQKTLVHCNVQKEL